MSYKFTGAKYAQGIQLSGSELSKAIRQDLKQITNAKFSVSKQSYTGGESINITLKQADFPVFNPLTPEIEQIIATNARRAFPYNHEEVTLQAIENYKDTIKKN